MALYRPPQKCPFCGKDLVAIYHKAPVNFIGDTFFGYAPCKCKGKGKGGVLSKLRDKLKLRNTDK